MIFKRLNSGDFSVSEAPIITQITSPTTASVDFNSGAGGGDIRSQRYIGITNIIGEAQDKSSGYILTLARKDFKQSIHPFTFSLGGVFVDSGSGDVEITKAGRKYTATDYDLYPDLGLAITDSDESSTDITACSEEFLTTSYVTIRILPSEFNYTLNPSFAANGESQIKDTFLLNPITYITTIGLYNDNGDLLAVAKTNKPLKKDFVTSYSLRVQLDF